MKLETILLIVAGVLGLVLIGLVIRKKTPRKLKKHQYLDNWKVLQDFCKDKKLWPQAIIDADKLLDSALKKRKFGGKSMGERLVSAQRTFTNNDGVWFAHNLRKKIVAKPTTRLKESDVKTALIAHRQALKDIGALPNGESKDA